MKYNFKNCRVVINAGTEALKIDGMGAPARETPAQEMAGEQISLVFDRALFRSAIDRNNTGVWEDTQLAAYLRGAFLDALRKETSADDCGLLRKEELWGDNALLFFRNGRNRNCFGVWYWTETVEDASSAYFYAYYIGYASGHDASAASYYVRPRFIILKS